MELKIYQIDAFSEKVFGGNPAAVVPLTEWLEDEILQKIALENNLSETAFYVREEKNIVLRWFTPGTEVDLCGHATLATAHVLFKHEGFEES
jgi:PhzF family phenazine biosynthesis protein